MPRDPHIWKELPPMANGFIPAVPREYMFTGMSRGCDCRFPVRLTAHVVGQHYRCTVLCCENVPYCPDSVRLDQLTEI